MSTGDGFGFFAKYYEANKTDNDTTVAHVARRGKKKYLYIVTRRLTTEIRSWKCVVRRFRRRANVTECTYTNLDRTAHYTPRLYGIAYRS
jgi:hypothetical protein